MLAFAAMLNEMRLGKLTPNTVNLFKVLDRALPSKDDFQATEL